ncbi:MAG: TolC family protein [Terriglobia bacterium]|jgi:outer membrane protein
MRHFVLRRIAVLAPSCSILWLLALYPQWAAPQQAPAPTLSLKDAEAMALRNHPLLQAANYDAEAANQITREEKSAYYPTARGAVTGAGALPGSRIAAGYLNNPIIYNRESNGLEVQQLITDFGRTSNLVGSARLGAKAASESAQQTAQDVLLAVNRAYFNVLRAEAVLKVAEETVKERQVLTDQVTALEKNKLKSMLDVSFAEVDLAQAKLLLVQAQNNEKASFADLATALGLGNPQPFDLAEEPMPAAPLADPTDLIVQALQDRPDLSSARFSHEAALRYARAERDLWMPTISATGEAGLTPAYQVPLTDRYAAAGINVSIPIFNGFLYSARHQEANLRAKAADQAMRDLADRISRDVRTAWLNTGTAYQRLAVTAELLKEATLALDLAQGRYKLGLSSIVELSQAQLNLTSAQIDDTSGKYDFQIQSAVLLYQTGQLH